jgi:hypothetical protein
MVMGLARSLIDFRLIGAFSFVEMEPVKREGLKPGGSCAGNPKAGGGPNVVLFLDGENFVYGFVSLGFD